jgi:hypothetical protein
MAKQTFFQMGRNPLGNAEVMLDLCRLEYVKAGRAADVEELKSISVRDGDGARMALLTVWHLPEDENVTDVKRYTVKAIRLAVRATERQRPMLQLAS